MNTNPIERTARASLRLLGKGLALAAVGVAMTSTPILAQYPWHCYLGASALSVGVSILEPGDSFVVRPSYRLYETTFRACQGVIVTNETGTATDLTGPPGSDYVIEDSAASYHRIVFSNPSYGCGDDCYMMSVSAPAERPSTHWDATFHESLTGSISANFLWALHIGDSFIDVARSQPFYQKIETLLHNGITSGCSPTEFCPDQAVSRGQMAVFVAKGLAKTAANIPASGTVGDQSYDCSAGGTSLFTDVSPTDMFCKHIHYIASKNVDAGCDPGLFCPGASLTRLQMAAFVANALVQPGGDAAVPLAYGPDSVTGLSYSCDPASPDSHFTDVPVTDPFCKDANYLWARGIIAGCSPTEYCPTGEVTRDAMAKFLVNAFKLTLYGP